jgi:hypothetical protein
MRSLSGGHKVYRRQHEKALAKIVDRIVDEILKEEEDIKAKIAHWKAQPETVESLAMVSDYSCRRYVIGKLKRNIRDVIAKSQNLLVATIVERMEN